MSAYFSEKLMRQIRAHAANTDEADEFEKKKRHSDQRTQRALLAYRERQSELNHDQYVEHQMELNQTQGPGPGVESPQWAAEQEAHRIKAAKAAYFGSLGNSKDPVDGFRNWYGAAAREARQDQASLLDYDAPEDGMTRAKWEADYRNNVTKEQDDLLKRLRGAQDVRDNSAPAAYAAYAQSDVQKPIAEYRQKLRQTGLTDHQIDTLLDRNGKKRTQQEELEFDSDVLGQYSREQKRYLLDYINSKNVEVRNGHVDPEAQEEAKRNKEAFLSSTGQSEEEFKKTLQYAKYIYGYNWNNREIERMNRQENTDSKLHNVAYGTGVTGAKVIMSPVAGGATFAEDFNQLFYADKDSPINTNSEAYRIFNFGRNAQAVTGENLSDYFGNKYGENAGDAAKWAYNTGVSVAESMYGRAIGSAFAGAAAQAGASAGMSKGVMNLATLPQFGASARASALQDGLARGLSESKAKEYANVAGLVEMATELLPNDKWYEVARSGKPSTALSAVSDFLVQSGMEGAEEAEADVLNWIADKAINGDNSAFDQSVAEYRKKYDEKTALKMATNDWLKDTALDALGGAVAGGFAAGQALAYNSAAVNRAAREQFGSGDYSSVQGLSGDRSDYASDKAYNAATEARGLADRLSARALSGEKIKAGDNRQLVRYLADIEAEEAENYAGMTKAQRAEVQNEQNAYAARRFENQLVPEALQTKAENYSAERGYKDMLEAAKTGSAEGFSNAYQRLKNSTSATARKNADHYFDLLSDMAAANGASRADMESGKMSLSEAYLRGARGEETAAPMLSSRKAAYNEGRVQFIKDSASRSVSDAGTVRDAEARVRGGGAAKITGISSVSLADGVHRVIKLATSDGREIAYSDASFADAAVQKLYGYAAEQGTVETMNAYLDHYKSGTPVGQYNNAFSRYYSQGAAGTRDFDTLYNADQYGYKAFMNKGELRAIYELGAQETSRQALVDAVRQGKSIARRGSGMVTDNRRNTKDNSYMPLVNGLAKALRVDVVLSDDMSSGINGSFDRAMQRITLNTGNTEHLYNTIFHEGFGEVMQAHNAAGAQRVRNAVLLYIADTYGADQLTAIGKKYQAAYNDVEGTKTFHDALGEAVNDSIAGLFTSKEGIHDLNTWMQKKYTPEKSRGILGDIANYFGNIARSIRNAIKNGELSGTSRRTAEMAENRAREIRQMILDEMDTAIENAKNAEVGTGTMADKRYSLIVDGEKAVIDVSGDFATDENGRVIPVILGRSFSTAKIRSDARSIQKYVKGELLKLTGNSYVIKDNGNRVYIDTDFAREYTGSNDTYLARPSEKAAKFNAHTGIPSIIENAQMRSWERNKEAKHSKDAKRGWNYYDVLFLIEDNGQYAAYMGVLNDRLDADGKEYVYDITRIQKAPVTQVTDETVLDTQPELSKNNIHSFDGKSNPSAGNHLLSTSEAVRNAEEVIQSIPKAGKRFSLDVGVQQKGNLIAVHNLSEEQFMSDIELGGFPSPSIAIIRAGMEHSKYGDISVLFHKDTVDPAKRNNCVYGGDAYTPTFPTIEYEVKDDARYEIANKMSADMSGMVPTYLIQEAKRFNSVRASDIASQGLDALVVEARGNFGIKAAYLAAKGIEVSDNIKEVSNEKYSADNVRKYDAMRDALKDIRLEDVNADKYLTVGEKKAKYGDVMKRAYYDYAKIFPEAKAKRVMQYADRPFGFSSMFDSLKNALDYYENGNQTHTEKVRDHAAIQADINAKIDNLDDLTAWLKQTYSAMVGKSGIRTDKDPFDAAGNRRSFRALHLPVTLNNLVKVMNADAAKGNGAIGDAVIFSMATRNFDSIEDMRSHEEQLKQLSDEEYADAKKKISDKFYNIAKRISREDDIYSASKGIGDAYNRYPNDPEKIEKYLKNEYATHPYVGVGRDIIRLANEVANMPTGYFEAKPMRSVMLDEIARVIAPDSVSDSFKDALDERGIRYELYPAGDEAARAEAVNEVEDIRFSVSVDPVLSKMYKEIESGKYSGKSFYDFDESVPNEIIDYVNRTLRIDISKYGNEITVDAIRHIINEHGANGKTDHSMKNPDDLARIKYVVNNFDKIWVLDRKTSFISNSDGMPASMIKLQKRIGDGYFYVVEAVADRSRKKIDIVSAYINKTDASLQASPAEAGSLYARSAPVSDASINTIKSHTENVNMTDLRRSLSFFDEISDGDGAELSRYETMFTSDADMQQSFDTSVPILEEGAEALKDIPVSKSAARRAATEIIRETGSGYRVSELSGNLEKVFAYMKQAKNVDYGDMLRVLTEVAQPVIDHTQSMIGQEEYDGFREALGSYTVKLNAEQLQNVRAQYGSLSAFRRVVPGLRIDQKNGMPLDRAFTELAELSYGVMDADVNAGDQPVVLADAMETLRPRAANDYGADNEQAAYDTALKIVERYFEETGRETADKKAKERLWKAKEKMKQRSRKYRADLRARYTERLAKSRRQIAEKYQGRLSDLREQKNGKYREDMARLRAQNRQRNQRAAENRRVRHEQDMITRRWGELFERLDNPTDNKHVPKGIERFAAELLDSIDISRPYIRETRDGRFRLRYLFTKDTAGHPVYSTREFGSREEALAAYHRAMEQGLGTQAQRTIAERMARVRAMYEQAQSGKVAPDMDENFLNLLDEELLDDIDALMKDKTSVSISTLSSADLHTVSQILRNVTSAMNNYGRMLTDHSVQYEDIAEQYHSYVKVHRERLHRNKAGVLESGANFLELTNATPDTYFHAMGEGGKATYDILLRAQSQKIKDVREAAEFMYGDRKKRHGAYVDGVMAGVRFSELAKWTGEKAELHRFNGGYGSIQLTTAQIMGLYELEKRQQAMLHTQGGIVADDIRRRFGKVISQDAQFFTAEEISSITGTLTAEQKRIADAMQQFMAKNAAAWGNEASEALYGYDKFGEADYYPISVDKTTVRLSNNNANNRGLINAVKNMGMTKKTVPNANNPLVVRDIFEVFSQHVSDMATYNAYAPALQDVLGVYNHKTIEKVADGAFLRQVTVKGDIEKIYGKKGTEYFEKLIGDLNANERSEHEEAPLSTLTSKYKAAAIAGNARVVFQQPTAWFRAGVVEDYNKLAKGFLPNAAADQMREETSALCWAKSNGNVDGVITQSMKQQITGLESTQDRVVNATMYLAGKADDITWANLYRGEYGIVEGEFKKAGKATVQGGTYTQEFADAVNARFENLVSKTQVIDTTLFRSQFMRSGDQMDRYFSAFMAEPTKTYNMLLQKWMDVQHDGLSKKTAAGFARAVFVHTVTSLMTAGAAAIQDAFRNDDDETKWLDVFLQYWRSNFLDNLNPLTMIPRIKTFWDMIGSAVEGNKFQNSNAPFDIQAVQRMLSSMTQIKEYVEKTSSGERAKLEPYGVLYSSSQIISLATGIPFANVTREFRAVYNEINDLWGGRNLFKTTSEAKNMYKQMVLNSVETGEDVEEALDAYIEYGGKTSGIKSKLSEAYKDSYVQAAINGDTEAMEKIREDTEKIYTAIAEADDKEYDAEEMFGGWISDYISDTYKDAYIKAFESGSKSEMEEISRNVESLMTKISEDKGKTAESKLSGWIKDSPKGEAAKKAVFGAVTQGGSYKDYIEKAVRYGYTHKGLQQSLTEEYKATYINLLRTNRSEAMKMENRLAEMYAYLSDRQGTNKKMTHAEKVRHYRNVIRDWAK
ncbi:PBECR3 domain-containing polyvalent protein [Lachnoclostridium sp. Marseille-P6806]|uniref:PBECR3 domain-containing polyvalent protein n=1 Tax=Lachnoclostridium sp. Marseille-P6806 TaxID=2364793 RepID=UPI00102F6A12|nr:hypothetical protein [Lachnoclostridium sp. Marseille-P6806]